MPVVVGCMMLVALVFGELASEYPLSGALYQYGKYNVSPRYGWFVGWIYGIALLATVASVDSGAVGYVTSLSNAWFSTHLDPASHLTIFAITGGIIALSGFLNSVEPRSWDKFRASACTWRRSARSASSSHWRSRVFTTVSTLRFRPRTSSTSRAIPSA